MSKREEILDSSRFGSENGIRRGLLYSEVLGWLDMGHAAAMTFVNLWRSLLLAKRATNFTIRCDMNKQWDRTVCHWTL